MNGLELSYRYYKEFGEAMLQKDFKDVLPYIAAGLCGSGSECLGFDDALSRDHDFPPGFCIFLPSEDIVDRRTAFLLQRAYDGLPKEYAGLKKSLIEPAGGRRRGVIRISDFLVARLGSDNGELTAEQWYRLPEQYLLEVTNGRLFFDNYGELSAVRASLGYFPEDIRLKKLSDSLISMAQSGQYNYGRCLARGEKEGAALAVSEFVQNAVHCCFLLSNRYMPYYKWSFRALRSIEGMAGIADLLSALLLSAGQPAEGLAPSDLMSQAAAFISGALQLQGLSDEDGTDLDRHGLSVMNRIESPLIRNMM